VVGIFFSVCQRGYFHFFLEESAHVLAGGEFQCQCDLRDWQVGFDEHVDYFFYSALFNFVEYGAVEDLAELSF